MKHYPAREWGTFDSPRAALIDAGLSAEQADWCIQNAAVDASEVIVANIGNGKGIAVTKEPDGTWRRWKACIGLLCDTPEEALYNARQIQMELPGVSEWVVFTWTPPLSKLKH